MDSSVATLSENNDSLLITDTVGGGTSNVLCGSAVDVPLEAAGTDVLVDSASMLLLCRSDVVVETTMTLLRAETVPGGAVWLPMMSV